MNWIISFLIGYQISAQFLAVYFCYRIQKFAFTPRMPWLVIGIAMLIMGLRRFQNLVSVTSSSHAIATSFDTLIIQTVISSLFVTGFYSLFYLLKKKV